MLAAWCRSPVLNFIFAKCQPVSLEFPKAYVCCFACSSAREDSPHFLTFCLVLCIRVHCFFYKYKVPICLDFPLSLGVYCFLFPSLVFPPLLCFRFVLNGFLNLKRSSEIQLCVSKPDHCSFFLVKTIQLVIKHFYNPSQEKQSFKVSKEL
jgi:hypothetical protein